MAGPILIFACLFPVLSTSFTLSRRVSARELRDVSYQKYLSHRRLISALSSTTAKNVPAVEQEKKIELAKLFCSHAEQSLNDGSFRTFDLVGPSFRGLKKQNPDFDPEDLRGCFKRVSGRTIRLQDAEVVQVTFKYHLATDLVKNWPISEVAHGLESLLILNDVSYDEESKSMTEQLASEWGSRVYNIGSTFAIQKATLETSNAVWELDASHKTKRPGLRKKKVANTKSLDDLNLAHDRVKIVPISTSSDFLQALGVTNPQGKPRPGKASKLRQIQKFVEIVGGLVNKATGDETAKKISVLDLGCGRGYLTFAVHSYLTEHYGETAIETRGIDIRKKLVDEINGISGSLGGSFGGLQFETGTIESFLDDSYSSQKDGNEKGEIDVLIALHACDTATDDALWAGICHRASVICVAPCCQKEIRPQIDKLSSQTKGHPLSDVLQYGIYRERMAETVTDSMRALMLEMVGYDVNVFEFIGGEHTSKNVMITAVKKPVGSQSPESTDRIRSKLKLLADFHGISHHRLATWMREDLGSDSSDSTELGSHVTRHGLPPR